MIKRLKSARAESSFTVVEDALGVITLFVLLFAGLHLPVFS
jgi:hypothetical protein